MPKITDTYANAYACCEQVLIETGKFPTIDAIRTRIGVNSPNTINNAIKAWTQDFAEKQLDKKSRPDIPLSLLQSIEQIWKLASTEAAKNYAEKENALKTSLVEMQGMLDEQQAAFNQAQHQIEALGTQNGELIAKVDVSALANEQLNQANKSFQEHITNLENQLLNKETQLVAQESKWLERQEQDQQWFARRLLEEKTFMEQTWYDKVQRQQETIQSITLSEESLRQTCVSLSRDHKKVTEELKELQKSIGQKRWGTVKNKRFPKGL